MQVMALRATDILWTYDLSVNDQELVQLLSLAFVLLLRRLRLNSKVIASSTHSICSRG